MPDEACRLAQAESNIENLCEKFDRHQEEEVAHLKRIWDSIEEIKIYQRNQQGFVRGVIFTVTAIVGGVGFLFDYFQK